MLASVVVRAVELLAVVLAAGSVMLAAGLWWVGRRMWSVPFPDRRWLAVARERRRLWRAVGAAEHAAALAAGIAAAAGAGRRAQQG